jgi:hypothetical protein
MQENKKMDIDIEQLISAAEEEKANIDPNQPKEAAPSLISLKQNLNLKEKQMILIDSLMDGLEKYQDLQIKLPGTCTYFKYNSKKDLTITDISVNVRFRIGEAGEEHIVEIPSGS